MTDVLGILTAYDDQLLTVRREDGSLVTVARRDLVTGKPIPPRASPRLRIEPEALQRICSDGLAPLETEHAGDWRLRAAGGFTRRANSTLVVGDPGLPVGAAFERVRDFYDRLDLPPMLQVVVGSDWQRTAEDHGWQIARSPDTVVQVASVAQARRSAAGQPRTDDVVIADSPNGAWMSLYNRAAETDAAMVRSVLQSGDAVGFATAGDAPDAIGRAVVTGDWVGFSAVEVRPAQRRHGLGSSVVEALLGWAAAHGAMSAYLQVVPDNDAAVALYRRYGFVTHHAYRYLTWPA